MVKPGRRTMTNLVISVIVLLPAAANCEYIEAAKCSRAHIEQALGGISSCTPREVVVQLPWPNNTDIQQMTPSHVLLKQCTGGCTLLEPSCLPSKTSTKKIPVLVAKCGINQGICDKECATIELEEHIECKCACALTPRDCSEEQQFVRSECGCKCTNVHERHACMTSSRTWNETTCSCSCPRRLCGPNMAWDEQNCTCRSLENIATRTILNMTNTELMSLEVMIIIFLISTLIVLVLLFLCLVWKLRSLRRVEGRKVLVPSTLSGAYLSSGDPCTDLKESNIPSLKEQTPEKEQSTDSSQCSESSQSNQSIEIVPTNANIAIRTGTLPRRQMSGVYGRGNYQLIGQEPGHHHLL